MTKKMFASDNNSGIHPSILEAISQANDGHAPAYGDDSFTSDAAAKFHDHFGKESDVLFAFNGTGANVIGLKAMVRSHQAIICTEGAHIHADEGGAAEGFIGGKLLTVPSVDGKLTVAQIEQQLHHIGSQHRSQPKAISISQCTELGTVYTIDEIQQLTSFAHANGLYVHMDGARISNAAAFLGCSLKEMTADAGIDMLSFGGTKNGMMAGEAIVCLNKQFAPDLKYIRKQGMQLGSKMRFISVQFERLLQGDLWLENAAHANRMALRLAEGLQKLPGIALTQPVESNAVFASVPGEQIQHLQKSYAFAIWDAKKSEIRLVTSFDTTEEDVDLFLSAARKVFA
ncbi:low specificity L-threonine aldolase [Planomicrobium sp. CPCC 101110]|uniref:threonine aldolase family protein n=1 Tax=Planomicrobium sp. CPCC 101110 TaxID=2599619 RepID=UPI0011B3F70E|nr:low specificity L-threonine aldolase [Planomicrobium sp. CPCC 101110]TWT24814.1 low specificity L-threonine aldolase [Planomicrobium sp. CPCC 101110]